MNQQIKQTILDKIKQYDRIVVSRHIRPDGDCTGATKGLVEILRLTYPQKDIRLINREYAQYMAFLGGEDEQVEDEFYADALMIVLDTASTDRIDNPKYVLAKELIKIDHHLDIKPYGDVSWVEDQRSSACEMVVDFYCTFRDELKINKEAATYLYTGMVTDSGRFKYAISGETMRCAGVLLDVGIDTEWLYANLNLDDYGYLKYQASVYKNLQRTRGGVAWLFVSKRMQKRFGLTLESASNSVSLLDGIKGSIIWVAFIENPKTGAIRIRLRSRFVHVNELAEKYNGGGHECACGASLKSKREIKAFLADADALITAYKATHKGWM